MATPEPISWVCSGFDAAPPQPFPEAPKPAKPTHRVPSGLSLSLMAHAQSFGNLAAAGGGGGIEGPGAVDSALPLATPPPRVKSGMNLQIDTVNPPTNTLARPLEFQEPVPSASTHTFSPPRYAHTLPPPHTLSPPHTHTCTPRLRLPHRGPPPTDTAHPPLQGGLLSSRGPQPARDAAGGVGLEGDIASGGSSSDSAGEGEDALPGSAKQGAGGQGSGCSSSYSSRHVHLQGCCPMGTPVSPPTTTKALGPQDFELLRLVGQGAFGKVGAGAWLGGSSWCGGAGACLGSAS